MRLVLLTAFAFILVLINQIDANEKPFIIVLGGRNSLMSRGSNAEVRVKNHNKISIIESSFGTMEINNELVDPKIGYVVEGNDDLDASNCKSGPLQSIIASCKGKLQVRNRKPEDNNLFGGLNFNFGN